MSSIPKPRWLCIAGPTASGKTRVALALAKSFDAEVISMDSALVFKGMDIGTAKPSAAQRADVPHHLIDVREPFQAYSAADFARDTLALTAQINARGRLALIVGGTMLYHRALVDGLADLPVADAVTRHAIEADAAALGWPGVHAQLAVFDPITAERLSPNDSQRIQRAVEVWRMSGKALSEWIAEQNRPERLDLPLLSLEPVKRLWLHAQIRLRFEAMLHAGLVDEVLALRSRGDLNADMTAMRCVGYRQTWELLDAGVQGADLHQQLMQTGVAATRQLAKRQLTWMRSLPERQVLACDSLAPDALVEAAHAWAASKLVL